MSRDRRVVRDTSNNSTGIVPVPHISIVPFTIDMNRYIEQRECPTDCYRTPVALAATLIKLLGERKGISVALVHFKLKLRDAPLSLGAPCIQSIVIEPVINEASDLLQITKRQNEIPADNEDWIKDGVDVYS